MMNRIWSRPATYVSSVVGTAVLLTLAGCATATQGSDSGGSQSATPRIATVPSSQVSPAAVFLTWQRDPTTTMTIDWHTEGQVAGAQLQFRPRGDTVWESRVPESSAFPFAEDVAMVQRVIHRVELTGLEPDATYQFRAGGTGEPYTFRTMPRELTRPVRFATGGDVHRNENMRRVSSEAAAYDPDFIMWGGDLAYADGLAENVERWFDFFDSMNRTLITPENRVIPVLVAIGNHEVEGMFVDNIDDYQQDDATRARLAPYFYDIFASPGQPGYAVLDFGEYMSVLLLDSDHTNPVDGVQASWLERRLAERQDVPHVFPLYHVPAFPSVRSPDGRSRRIRETWVPLFEKYGISVVFENHDHAYKRTYPMRGGEPSRDGGVVYIGDGAWGVNPREVGRDHEGGLASYLERAESVRHFILGEIRGEDRFFIMVDERGSVFDEYPEGSETVIGNPRFRAVDASSEATP
jgi:acid phosphatase type 7